MLAKIYTNQTVYSRATTNSVANSESAKQLLRQKSVLQCMCGHIFVHVMHAFVCVSKHVYGYTLTTLSLQIC